MPTAQQCRCCTHHPNLRAVRTRAVPLIPQAPSSPCRQTPGLRPRARPLCACAVGKRTGRSAGATTRMVSAVLHWVPESLICLCRFPLCLSLPSLLFLLPVLFFFGTFCFSAPSVSPHLFWGRSRGRRVLTYFFPPSLHTSLFFLYLSLSFSASLILHLSLCVSSLRLVSVSRSLSLSLCVSCLWVSVSGSSCLTLTISPGLDQ